MDERLDEIDKRILYRLAEDARNTSAPMIAEEVNVSGATIRNRIAQLEDKGIIDGYHADINYERAGNRMRNLLICTAPIPERETLAKKVLNVPGVVDVRELLTGRNNIHVVAIGADTDDLTAVSRRLTEMGLEVEDEHILHMADTAPLDEFGPETKRRDTPMTDFLSLAGGAEVVELAVSNDAPIAGLTLSEANERGLLDDDVLVIAIERDDEVITPRGFTRIAADDLVTVFTRGKASEEALDVFTE
ncbi:transcriptional regulator, AsnC family [Halarchaeum acidiphilum MH1-52-1]|uniref:Transcriptional regulator, AsnC family n=1 Tax=Halarchaeum acidiphilum MH1-52-1 TaxID=1261545 RepID=U2YTQ7_9EURY|nr:Lrp/AsnC family transcriptional regulator [Halarchaeum acidiphilum]GAD52380.1 transcriptional regulator, AsnC family [Halarchaeum acidiphilum MH1-52-1]